MIRGCSSAIRVMNPASPSVPRPSLPTFPAASITSALLSCPLRTGCAFLCFSHLIFDGPAQTSRHGSDHFCSLTSLAAP
jgi:hypothetical protein